MIVGSGVRFDGKDAKIMRRWPDEDTEAERLKQGWDKLMWEVERGWATLGGREIMQTMG